MTKPRKSRKKKSVDELLNQSEAVVNRSREIMNQGEILSRHLTVLEEQSLTIIDWSQQLLRNLRAIGENDDTPNRRNGTTPGRG